MRLTCLLLLGSLVHAGIVTYNWDITYVEDINPDGLYPRRVIGVNGAWPPPPLEATYNDTLVVNVHNSLDVPTSLHAHGFFQNGTNVMDGPSMVTQCGIPPGQNYTYTIPVQQWGTYWFHAHYRASIMRGARAEGQYADGLRTPLILHPLGNETYSYDEEMVVQLSDWYHEENDVGLATYLNRFNPTGAEPVPQSALINNVGPAAGNASLYFTPGKTYRLRFLNTGALAMFTVWLDGHSMQVIEIDGVEVERKEVPAITLTTAQRVSVLVTAQNNTNTNYWLHANMVPDMFDKVPANLIMNLTANVVYNNASNTPFAPAQENPIDPMTGFDDTSLVPVHTQGSADPDTSITMAANFQVMTDTINHATFNNVTYVAGNTPTLVTAMTMGNASMDPATYGPNSNAYVIKHLDMVELVLNNMDVGHHPFHLHGHQFQIIGRGDGPYDPTNPYNASANPSRRDTVQVPGGGNVVIRFRADNPGVWLFHCHIEWHIQAGLVAQIIEAPDILQQRQSLPPVIASQCADLGFATSGNGAGNLLATNFTNYPFGPSLVPDGFTAKGKGAMAGCIISALIGMGTVIWYAKPDKQEAQDRKEEQEEKERVRKANEVQ